MEICYFVDKKNSTWKGQSAKTAFPPAKLSEAELLYFLKASKEKIQKLSSLPKEKYFSHPYFGHLTLKQAIPFLQIHTEHHLKIIRDILKATK